MLNKRLLIMVFLLGVMGVVMFALYDAKDTKRSSEPKDKNDQVFVPAETTSAKSNSASQELLTNPTEADPNSNTDEQQAILNEIEQRLYSQDPYVELTSLIVQMGFCHKEFRGMDFLTSSDTVFQQQLQLTQDLKKECENYQQQYPHLLTMDEKKIRNTFIPNSPLGRLMKAQENRDITRSERDENSQLTLVYALKEKNSSLIMLSALFLRYERSNMDLLQTILNSKDNNYMAQMNQMALTLMSCEHQSGQACQSTSMLMVLSCAENPDSCGLDFQTWYDQNTLSGMKRDVEKLMAYYQQLAD